MNLRRAPHGGHFGTVAMVKRARTAPSTKLLKIRILHERQVLDCVLPFTPGRWPMRALERTQTGT